MSDVVAYATEEGSLWDSKGLAVDERKQRSWRKSTCTAERKVGAEPSEPSAESKASLQPGKGHWKFWESLFHSEGLNSMHPISMQVDAKQVMEVEEVEADGEVVTLMNPLDETIAEATC